MSQLRNVNTGAILATRVDRATSALGRAIGLLRRKHLSPDEGLLIERCKAIHTVGMRTDIDVIFVDRSMRVVALHAAVRPFCFALACRDAVSVIELGAGAVELHDILPGDCLELV